MKQNAMAKEINIAPFFRFLNSWEEKLACLVVLCFVITPLAETFFCLTNKAERIFPMSFYPYIILHVVQPLVIILGGLVILSCIYRWQAEKIDIKRFFADHWTYAFFLGTVIWIVLSSIVTGTISNAFFGDSFHNEPLSLVLSYFVIFFFSASRIKDSEKKEVLIAVTILISIIVGAYSLYDYFFPLVITETSARLSGVFINTNFYGYYLCVHIMLCSGLFALGSRKSYTVLGMVGLTFNTLILSFNNTFGAWLACFFAMIFQAVVLYIVFQKTDRRSLISFVCFLVVSFIMGFWTMGVWSNTAQLLVDVENVTTNPAAADTAGSGRWILWKVTVGEIINSPLFGYGNEGISDVLAFANCSRPHNEVMQYAAFFGIPAAVMYVAGVLSVFIRGYRNRKTLEKTTIICLTGAFGYFVSSMFGNTMYYTAPFFFIFLGMGYHHVKRKER